MNVGCAEVMIDSERDACGFARFRHLDRVYCSNGNRLVAEDMLSRRGRSKYLLTMVSIRGADINRLQRVVCQHLIEPTRVSRHTTRARERMSTLFAVAHD